MTTALFALFLPVSLCACAALLKYATWIGKYPLRRPGLEQQIDELLPQTQCGKCDYAGCRPYARAIAGHETDINRCPPGGTETVRRIADLLGRDYKALQTGFVHSGPAQFARIDEQACIGCVKCIKACPVDAIVGAAKQLHTVIDKACTGCELCLAPCPVNCITMVPVNVKIKQWIWTKPRTPAETGP